MALQLYNSLTRKKEEFVPINPPNVGMYTCGPTVYDYMHIGNLRKYVEDDVLKRVLLASGYKVKQVMNITDVGHLTSDADEGDDKLEKSAKEKGKSVWEVAKFFENYFFKSTDAMGIRRPEIVSRATEHIRQQIELIQKLEEKGFTYKTDRAIYYDISKFPKYGELSGQKVEEKVVGARSEVVVDSDKKHPVDFALWFFTVGRFANHSMRWPSPWGEGFPGWHIECSAMAMNYLGETIDIHTGGVDHLTVHHPNEIAQSEAATGKQFVRFWVHDEFLLVDGEKMSKSKRNFYTIDDIIAEGVKPMALRYLFLTARYRDFLNFTWESLKAAQTAFERLKKQTADDELLTTAERTVLSAEKENKIEEYREKFWASVNDDLNMPQALAVVWEVTKSNMPLQDKRDLILSFDEVLGLGLGDKDTDKDKEVPLGVMKLAEEREKARREGDYKTSDKLREKIKEMGYVVEDMYDGIRVKKV